MYRVGIVTYTDRVEATVFDLPGCGAGAPDMAAVQGLLPVVIAEYAGWLRRHGEQVQDRTPVEFEFVEQIDPASIHDADGEFCFEDDHASASQEDVETAIRYMDFSRRDLLDVTTGLPDQVLDWRPPASAMATINPWNPDVLPIRQIGTSIAAAEGYYRTGLEDGEPASASPDEIGSLELQRERVVVRLRNLTEDERTRVFRPRRPWQKGRETWTARKVMRRIISHERFHTKEIEQRLAWLLLGVPDFERSRTEAQEGATFHG